MSGPRAKPVTPYARLLDQVRQYLGSVRHPHTRLMWLYPKARLSEHWSLSDLYERTRAADQLGYDVVLVADDTGLAVKYRKRPDDEPLPWDLRP